MFAASSTQFRHPDVREVRTISWWHLLLGIDGVNGATMTSSTDLPITHFKSPYFRTYNIIPTRTIEKADFTRYRALPLLA